MAERIVQVCGASWGSISVDHRPCIGLYKAVACSHITQTSHDKLAHDQYGHQCVGRTLGLLKSRSFWTGMTYQVKEHVADFFQCRVAKAPIPKIRAPMKHLLALHPLELLAIDFLKLDRSKGGFEDVLVLTNAFTKYSQAIACPDQSALTVAKTQRSVVFQLWTVHSIH